MFKKIGVAAVVVGAGMVLLHTSGLSSYTHTAWNNVRKTFKKQVPLEFEIERLRHEVAQLVPEMKKNISSVAEESVAVENLKKEVANGEASLKKQEARLKTMVGAVKNGLTEVSLDGRTYSLSRVKDKMARDWNTFQITETELKSKKQLLEAKEKALEATVARLDEIKSQRTELELEIAKLETELKSLRLAQARSKIYVDDSRLSRCKEVLADIQTRLRVEQKNVELQDKWAGESVPADKAARPSTEVISEIQARFGGATEDGKALVEKK